MDEVPNSAFEYDGQNVEFGTQMSHTNCRIRMSNSTDTAEVNIRVRHVQLHLSIMIVADQYDPDDGERICGLLVPLSMHSLSHYFSAMCTGAIWERADALRLAAIHNDVDVEGEGSLGEVYEVDVDDSDCEEFWVETPSTQRSR